MEVPFNSFKDAAKYAKLFATEYRSSPKVVRNGSGFSLIFSEKMLRRVDKKTMVIATVVAGLMAEIDLQDSPEKQLVLEAIYRSNSELIGMSEGQLGEYLNSLDPEQLKGFISNVKGIYHEISFVNEYNSNHDDSTASLHSETNHPGADVVITSDDGSVHEIQLKSTDSTSYVMDHTEKYPNIDVYATEEVASQLSGVSGSGFTNEELHENVTEVVNDLIDPSSVLDVVSEFVGLVFGFIGILLE